MPLASTFALQWFGEACSAAVLSEPSAAITAGIEGWAQPDGTLAGGASIPTADATRLVNRPATLAGSAVVSSALPKGRARPTVTISIGSRPTADDVAQAVWGSATTITEEPGTMAQALRLLLALAKNRMVTNPATGKLTVYDDDDATVLLSGDLWENAAGTVPYSGSGAERRDRLA